MHANQLMSCVKRVALICTKRTPSCTCSLFERHFSVHLTLRASKKRDSPYSSVDSGRYSSLVKSVVSRVSSQTPESIEEEDSRFYGPVVKSHNRTSRLKGPKLFHPFLNCDHDDGSLGREFLGPPARVPFKRGGTSPSAPSVTRILQDTLTPQQRFYLERWKRRMIAELGEEGFQEYTQSKFRVDILHNRIL